jgi:hypothetical protein
VLWERLLVVQLESLREVILEEQHKPVVILEEQHKPVVILEEQRRLEWLHKLEERVLVRRIQAILLVVQHIQEALLEPHKPVVQLEELQE